MHASLLILTTATQQILKKYSLLNAAQFEQLANEASLAEKRAPELYDLSKTPLPPTGRMRSSEQLLYRAIPFLFPAAIPRPLPRNAPITSISRALCGNPT